MLAVAAGASRVLNENIRPRAVVQRAICTSSLAIRRRLLTFTVAARWELPFANRLSETATAEFIATARPRGRPIGDTLEASMSVIKLRRSRSLR